MVHYKMFLRTLLYSSFLGLVFTRYFIVGPAQIKILSVDPCPEYPNLPGQFVLKRHKFNETTEVYDGFFSLPMDLNENVTLNLKCSRIDKSKKQVNSFVINDAEACFTMVKYLGDLWLDMQSQIGMEPGVCPVKMGNYSIKNAVLDLSKLNVQMILEGVFRSRVLMKNSSKPFYCEDFMIELSPKNPK